MFDEKSAIDGLDLGALEGDAEPSTTHGTWGVSQGDALPVPALAGNPVAVRPIGGGKPVAIHPISGPPGHVMFGAGYPPPVGYQGAAAGTQFDWLEAKDTSQSSAMKSAGLSALFVVGSLGVGVALGGGWGAVSGVLLSGAAMNTYRAQKWWGSQAASEKHEAMVSAVFAIGGLALGGYSAYRAYQVKTGEK
jgi:hypothetical protein